MRLTTVFLIAFLLQLSAATLAQKVSMNLKNASLKTAIREIKSQTGYDFVYQESVFESARPVTIKTNKQDVLSVLKEIFENQPLTYELRNNTVIVKAAEKSFLDKVKDVTLDLFQGQTVDVRGRVLDENNMPLSGATINVKGTNQGTKTDAQGNFYLANVDEKVVLVVSFVGFKTREVGAKADVGILVLEMEDNALEQVQVIAYGEVQKRFSTSSAISIKGEDIRNQPVSNPLIALQGRAPGLFIKQSNGLNTGAINVTIQGRNSLNNAGTPFYVIDGVPLTANALTQGISAMGSIGSGGSISNINFLNPNEIESITILKDADATAIYGSRAANGAILITTRRGKAGQTKVDLNLQNGWGKVANPLKMLNTEQYVALRKEAYINANQNIPTSAVDINGVWDPNRNVDWQKELLGETAQYQNLQASISGGSDQTQFLAGAGYIRETPVFKGDFSNVKTSVNFNLTHASNDQKFRFFLSGSYLEGNNQMPIEDITADVTQLAPNFPVLYNADGTINWGAIPDLYPNQVTYNQPAAKLLNRYTNKASNLVANSALSYEVIPGLIVKSTFGYNSLQNDETGLNYTAAIVPQDRIDGTKPSSTFSDKSIKSWIIEPQVTYSRTFSFGTIDGLLGSTFQSTNNRLLTLKGEQYNSDGQLGDFNSAGRKLTLASLQSEYNYAAIFGRINYRLKDRYIINLAARRDGSSRFGSENLFHSFYSIGGAWIFSEENLIKRSLPFINYGKFRASYGSTGNDQIGDYQFLSLYDTYSAGITSSYLGVTALLPRGLSNPYLQWEETRKLNFGVDIGILRNNRILITANYFRNRSTNQLLGQNLSNVTGFPTITRNLPALVQNTGWELSLGYTPVKSNNFTWNGAINFTLPKNKLLKYEGIENTSDNSRFAIGESLSILKLFSYGGVNPEKGVYQFHTTKGEMVQMPSDPTDRSAIVNLDPKWYGGFNNTFTYKSLSLDVFFQFMSQTSPNLKFDRLPGLNFNQNQLADVVNHWKKPGDNTPFQKVTSNFLDVFFPWFYARQSDGAYSRVTYARLNNATLAYTVNGDLIKRAKLSSARLYVQGQNLFTISNLKNGDPEVPSFNSLGLLRMFTVGAQLTF